MTTPNSNLQVCNKTASSTRTAATVLLLILSANSHAESALPKEALLGDGAAISPVANAAFAPGPDAGQAAPLHGTIRISQTRMTLSRELAQPVCDGRPVEMGGSCSDGTDKRLFPEIELELFSFADDTKLGAAEIGTMIGETGTRSGNRSYWHVIPQYGRVWKEADDGDWSRAAMPIMLVHDFENVAHQGLMTFLYRDGDISKVRMQFVQQSTPWNTPEHFNAWATADAAMSAADASGLSDLKANAELEISQRLEARPWSELEAQYPAGALDGFGGPLSDDWIVLKALVKDGVVYYHESETPYGVFPYPQDMRFGVRSMTKSVTVPLALASLSQAYGPYVLNLKIGDYVDGLHPGYDEVRFIDAANMATGMGGTGDKTTVPNNGGSGYVDEYYDAWYNGARSAADKIEAINRDTGPYPWGPGVVYRYRDRDFHLLGMAADGFIKAMRGPDAHIWRFMEEEVFRPIGIFHAPIVTTKEADPADGLPWFHAGFYPTLDDMAKIGLLYQARGRHGDRQILHAGIAETIFSTEGTLLKDYDHSLEAALGTGLTDEQIEGRGVYKMGFHFEPYENADGTTGHAPTMAGFAATTSILHPNGMVSIRFAKAWPMPEDARPDETRPGTMEVVNRLR